MIAAIAGLTVASLGAEPTNWWSNAAEVVNVSEFFEEELRLSQGHHAGHVEGMVALPELGASQWLVSITVRTDESADIAEEFVDITINGELVGSVFNSPPGETIEFAVPVEAGAFTYRFDFYSPVLYFSGHLVVEAGEATPLTCEPDLTLDGSLDILDFVAFQNAFLAGGAIADCDRSGAFDVLDFVCYQGLFLSGCR